MATGSDKQQSQVPQDPDPEATPDTDDEEKDEVQEQSEESFPVIISLVLGATSQSAATSVTQ